MLPEVGGSELVLIAIVALIVVGPKDLPKMLRTLGQFVGRLRGMAAEFRASFDEMARQSELDELRKEVEAMRKGQILDQAAQDASTAEVSQIFHEIGDSLNAGDVTFSPAMAGKMEPIAEPPPAMTMEAAAPPPLPAKDPPDLIKPKAKRAAKSAPAKPAPAKPAAAKAKTPAKRAPKSKTGTVS